MATTELPRYADAEARGGAFGEARLGAGLVALVRGGLAALASLRLTVTLMALSLVLILAGSLAQIDFDVWHVLHNYFRVWVARIELKIFFPRSYEWPEWAAFYYPGGKLLGSAPVAVNLLAAHAVRFRVAARGGRLMFGSLLIAVGAAVTYLVVVSGANTAIESALSPEFAGGLWHALRACLGGAALALGYVLALSRKRASKAAGRWLWWLGAVVAVLMAALAAYLFTHPEARLNASGLRILWQLTKGTAASVILALGCWAVFSRRAGIVLLHSGVALLMFSELYTASRAVEAQMAITEGQTATFAQDMRSSELVITDTTHPRTDRITIVPASILKRRIKSGELVKLPDLPFALRVVEFLPNATRRLHQPGEAKTSATAGIGLIYTVDSLPQSTGVDDKQAFNAPAAYVEVVPKKGKGSLGSFLVSTLMTQDDVLVAGDASYQVALRWKRIPKSYNVTLVDFKFERYEGTNTAKNFESVVEFRDPAHHVDLTQSISMNNPLRYAGDTLYQADYDPETEATTYLQVVSNSGWMVPYVACMIVATGMLVHFVQAIVRFVYRREEEARRTATGVEGIALSSKRRLEMADWRRVQVWGPALVVLVFAGWVASRATPPKQSAMEMKIHDFGALPVAQGGRIMPMDSLANNVLRTISGRQTYEDAGFEDRQPAIRWMLDTVTRAKGYRDHRVIRIENLDVLSALSLPRREGYRYSIGEIFGGDNEGKASELDRQVEFAQKVPEGERNLTQKKFLELSRKLGMVVLLMESFSKPEIAGKSQELQQQILLEAIAKIQQLSAMPSPRVVPPKTPEGSWRMLLEAETQSAVASIIPNTRLQANEAATSLSEVLDSYGGDRTQAFNSQVAAYRDLVQVRADAETVYEDKQTESGKSGRKPAERLNLDRLQFEAYYNHFDPLNICMVLYIIAFVLAAAAWLGWFEGLNRAANWLLWFTFALHTIGMVCRVYISGRPPVTNLYSSAIFIGWAAVLFALVFEAIYRLGLGNLLAAFVGFPTMVIAHYLSFDNNADTIGVMQAVLDTNFWLATHVVCITLGYATTFLAGALGQLTILMGVVGGRLNGDQRRQLTRMTYGTLCFAIFFSFIGTVLGGLWADDSWGRFWGWDPKENGALMIVIWNAIVLHARWGKMVGERGLAALAVLGNIVVAWSWFGVNQMPVGLHAYGKTEGRSMWIAAFMISQLLIAALPYVMAAVRRNEPRSVATG